MNCKHGLPISTVEGATFEDCEITRELLQDWHSEMFNYPNGKQAEVTYRVAQAGETWYVVDIVLSSPDRRLVEEYLSQKHNISLE